MADVTDDLIRRVTLRLRAERGFIDVEGGLPDETWDDVVRDVLRLADEEALAEPTRPAAPTQADVLAWVVERWPDRASVVWRAMKFGEESGEVLGAVVKESIGLKTMADVETESAQSALCLMALAEAAGFDLAAAIVAEWDACATRVWERADA